MIQVEIKSAVVSYGTLTALRDISFDISQGEYICLVGANGSGKSSLLKAILGLIPLDSGSVSLLIPKEDIAYLAQKQEIPSGFPATVKEAILTGTQSGSGLLYRHQKRDYASVQETMDLLKISDLAGRRIGELSGGQQKRVFLARALCAKPKMLILDEPCAGLDPQISIEFYEILKGLHESGLTVLMASHDIAQIKTLADRMIVMNSTIEFDGSTEEYRHEFE